jgi:hypothetical protein
MQYYSDQVRGDQTRNIETITPSVWAGIVSIISTAIDNGSFGESFPENCDDSPVPIGTNTERFKSALLAEIPDLQFPFKISHTTNNNDIFGASTTSEPFAPDYLIVLDTIQFSYHHIAKPIQGSFHNFFNHYHLTFNKNEGKREFRDKINRIFERNRIAYTLQEDGNILRIAPAILDETLHSVFFRTSDLTLNRMLNEARDKFLNPDIVIRRESLERLWDAWERIKTVLDPSNKRRSVGLLLDKCATESNFRELLEDEATKLTTIGNTFQIRHSEVTQTEIETSSQVDYIFQRLFSLIWLCIQNIDS